MLWQQYCTFRQIFYSKLTVVLLLLFIRNRKWQKSEAARVCCTCFPTPGKCPPSRYHTCLHLRGQKPAGQTAVMQAHSCIHKWYTMAIKMLRGKMPSAAMSLSLCSAFKFLEQKNSPWKIKWAPQTPVGWFCIHLHLFPYSLIALSALDIHINLEGELNAVTVWIAFIT